MPTLAALVLGTACGGRAKPDSAGSTASPSRRRNGRGRPHCDGKHRGYSRCSGHFGFLRGSGRFGFLRDSRHFSFCGGGGCSRFLRRSGHFRFFRGGRSFRFGRRRAHRSKCQAAQTPCQVGYGPLQSDDTMKYGPALYPPPDGGSADTMMQPEVLQWMTETTGPAAHVIWHAVPRLRGRVRC